MVDELRQRCSYLASLFAFTAALWGINMLVSVVEVSFAPNEVFYHEIRPHWQLNVTLTMALIALVPLLVPSRFCVEGCAWLISGSMANVFAASFWKGVPDYFSVAGHLLNSADVTLTIGEGMLAAATAAEVWRLYRAWRRAAHGEYEDCD